jgi:S-ribosylhomocysteine lyase LuxS involved in autoinducer biosynthesis
MPLGTAAFTFKRRKTVKVEEFLTTSNLWFVHTDLTDKCAYFALKVCFDRVGSSHAEWGSRVVYFGPMGCRTRCYHILEGARGSLEILPLSREILDRIRAFTGDIPRAAPGEYGNWREQNLEMAQWEAKCYAENLRNAGPENLNYSA